MENMFIRRMDFFFFLRGSQNTNAGPKQAASYGSHKIAQATGQMDVFALQLIKL